ncbi:hypothetical protein Taro_024462 [Colocasia esculenta]|uniref:Uncharacterized protein n=1 Tax=Colocasia esculenta TaxID=4460 RepID=A0A843V9F0_COLES|nr:hypothetical protein [Colocasia esculenta]
MVLEQRWKKERVELVGEMLSAENKNSFLPARQNGSYLTCLDVSRKYGSKVREGQRGAGGFCPTVGLYTMFPLG